MRLIRAALLATAVGLIGPVGLVIGLFVGIAVADSVESDAPARCVE